MSQVKDIALGGRQDCISGRQFGMHASALDCKMLHERIAGHWRNYLDERHSVVILSSFFPIQGQSNRPVTNS
jgi:hypothetical protein